MNLIGTSFHESGDNLLINRTQDCTPIAEHTKALHNAGAFGTSELKHAASIPVVIVEKYCNEQNISFADCMADPVHIKRIVMNPDNAMFRVWKGAL